MPGRLSSEKMNLKNMSKQLGQKLISVPHTNKNIYKERAAV